MKEQIIKEINDLYDNILMKSGFFEKSYIKNEIISMCRDIQIIERTLMVLIFRGDKFPVEILNMVKKIREFTCGESIDNGHTKV